MLPKNLAFVDIETTGGSLNYDRIIEVAVLRVENNILVDSYTTLINPECRIPEEIEKLTGITTNELASSPTFVQIKQEILDRLEGCVFVAHNVRFDYGFLKQEFLRAGSSYNAKNLCTVKLSRRLYPQFKRHNLDSVIERCNLECTNRHRAFDDAKAIHEFYTHTLTQFTEDKVGQAVQFIMKKPSLPAKLDAAKIDALPESPGIYIFYGGSSMPLYVGKSVNIRDRVLSHFSGDITSNLEMKLAQQVEDIEIIVTPGELSALLLEAETVKKLQPMYNRKLRKKQRLVLLKKKELIGGYLGTTVELAESIAHEEVKDILGVFRTKKQAKNVLMSKAEKHHLCEVLLGIEKSSGACFAHRLGNCLGACVHKELPELYNVRFIEAFAPSSFQTWPFDSPVSIQELDHASEDGVWHIVDKWCYLGYIRGNGEYQDISLRDEVIFDLDLYNILRSFLRSKKRSHLVRKIDAEWLRTAMTQQS